MLCAINLANPIRKWVTLSSLLSFLNSVSPLSKKYILDMREEEEKEEEEEEEEEEYDERKLT